MTELRERATWRPFSRWAFPRRASARRALPSGLVFLLKASVTGGLVVWLISSETLDPSSLSILVESPKIAVATLGTWMLVAVVLSTWRWRFILRAAGVSLPVHLAVVRQVTALFFNAVVPGNVGGDVLKNYQIFGGRPGAVVLAALVERVIGLVGLLWVGTFAAAALGLSGGVDSALLPLVALVSSLALLCALVPIALTWAWRRGPGPSRMAETDSPPRGVLGKGWAACRSALFLFEHRPSALVWAWAVSLALHTVHTLYFFLLTRQLGNPEAELAQVAAIYPVGMLTIAIPVSLSGLGVGHVAFEHLFRLLSLNGGANVFNVFIVGALAPSLIGAIPFVIFKGGFARENVPDSGGS